MKCCNSDVRCVRLGLAVLAAAGVLMGPVAAPVMAGCWQLVVENCEDCNSVPAGLPEICYQQEFVGCLIIVCQSADGPCPCEGFIEYTLNRRNNIVPAAAGTFGKIDYEIDENIVCAYANPCEELCEAASCQNIGMRVEWTCASYKLIGNLCSPSY